MPSSPTTNQPWQHHIAVTTTPTTPATSANCPLLSPMSTSTHQLRHDTTLPNCNNVSSSSSRAPEILCLGAQEQRLQGALVDRTASSLTQLTEHSQRTENFLPYFARRVLYLDKHEIGTLFSYAKGEPADWHLGKESQASDTIIWAWLR